MPEIDENRRLLRTEMAAMDAYERLTSEQKGVVLATGALIGLYGFNEAVGSNPIGRTIKMFMTFGSQEKKRGHLCGWCGPRIIFPSRGFTCFLVIWGFTLRLFSALLFTLSLFLLF